ncbi:hypothetical protein A6D6_04242 [Alcanivorax xiamenensis]|uniref:DUF4224 domain-containing protein n=1 Tax=Alcanivorax xiamenensis TaxID=1177156 RepID=A0ABQ6Y2T4_9GAMM|nr:hypothetical protein A6D6_04242 [Alcanivorax xiamenensis]
MGHPALVYEEELMEMSGYTRRKDLQKWLDQHHVWYLPGKEGRISTTVEALNRAGLGASNDEWDPV